MALPQKESPTLCGGDEHQFPTSEGDGDMPSDTVSVVSCEPWPAESIYHYKNASSGRWGYLTVYADGRFEFSLRERPSEAEINARWRGYFSDENR